jgi:hypothetical protein
MFTSLSANRRTARTFLLLGYLAVLLLAVWSSPTIIPAEAGDDPAPSLFDPPAVPERLRFPAVQVRRDPFTPSLEIGAGTEGMPSDDGGGIVLPPNAAAEEGATATRSVVPTLRAVILGASPRALVDLAGRSVVVAIGSPLLSSIVTAIGKDGVVLQDGESLHFAEKHP